VGLANMWNAAGPPERAVLDGTAVGGFIRFA
jgi:hypothetical protein